MKDRVRGSCSDIRTLLDLPALDLWMSIWLGFGSGSLAHLFSSPFFLTALFFSTPFTPPAGRRLWRTVRRRENEEIIESEERHSHSHTRSQSDSRRRRTAHAISFHTRRRTANSTGTSLRSNAGREILSGPKGRRENERQEEKSGKFFGAVSLTSQSHPYL